MKKTDGLGDSKLNVLWVMCRTNKLYSYEMFKGDLRTYISGCLPREKIPDYYGGGTDKWAWEELRKEGFNACLKSVKQALGLTGR